MRVSYVCFFVLHLLQLHLNVSSNAVKLAPNMLKWSIGATLWAQMSGENFP